MASLSRDLVFLILQFLEQENFKGTLHKLEEESGLFFNMRFFEDLVLESKLEAAEKYFSGFSKMEDNSYSTKIFLEIRRLKFLEALARNEKQKALDILLTEMKAFCQWIPDLLKEMAVLLTSDNLREHGQFGIYGDVDRARQIILEELKVLIVANPLLREKLQFPKIETSRLRHLINQSLNWQHCLPNNSNNTNPDIETLFVDHSRYHKGAHGPSSAAATIKSMQNAGAFSSLGFYGSDAKPSFVEGNSRTTDATLEKCNVWKLTEISEPSQLHHLQLPEKYSFTSKVLSLTYSNAGNAVLALSSNAFHRLWKWFCTDENATMKKPAVATTSVAPELWRPPRTIVPLINLKSDVNMDKAVHTFALSKNDNYVVSTSGKEISLFNMMTFKAKATFMEAPPVATSIALHPHDYNIIVIGMEDSVIQIYNVKIDEVKFTLRRHQKRITGLAFSTALNSLISSGADAQLCAWSLDEWEMKYNAFLQVPKAANLHSEAKIQFHPDQTHLLVIQETQLAIYNAARLESLEQWMPQEVLITHAAYSCDGQMIYTSLIDGSVNIFTESLRLRCRIKPTAYLNAQPSSAGCPLVLAAHPSDRNQFAMGLSHGHVIILEPRQESEWGAAPPPE